MKSSVIASIALSAALLGGCGGDGNDAPPTGGTPGPPPVAPQPPAPVDFNTYVLALVGSQPTTADRAEPLEVDGLTFLYVNDQETSFDSLLASP